MSTMIGALGNLFAFKNNNELFTGWVYACVTAIIDEVAGIEIVLYRYDSKGNKEIVLDHPSLDILDHPNPYMTKYEMFRRLQGNEELHGNEYWLMETDKSGVPLEIYPLMPDLVTPVIHDKEYIAYYKYRMGGNEYNIPKEKIVHFKNYNPKSDILGIGTLQAVKLTAELDEASKAFNQALLKNGAIPGTILEYPGVLTKAQKDLMLKSWDEQYAGFKKAYRTAIADGGLKINRLQLTHADMEMLAQRKFNKEEILGIFRVPPTILGMVDSVVYASAKATDYIFARRNTKPKMKAIIDTLNHKFLPLWKDASLAYDFISPVREDRQEQISYYQSGLNWGYLCQNDVRRMENLPEIENGNTFYIPFNITPYSTLKQKSTSPELPEFKIASKMAKKVMELRNKSDMEAIEKIGEQKIKESDVRAAPYVALFQKAAEQLFDNQKQKIIKKLEGLNLIKGVKVSVPDLLDEEEEITTTIDLFEPLFGQLTESEGQTALRALGLNPADFTLNTPAVREFIKKNTRKFAGVVTDTTNSDIRAMVIAGYEQGEGAAAIGKRVRDAFAFSKNRAERIARTETTRAAGTAEKEAWKQSGVVKEMQWFTAIDDRSDTECEELHLKKIPLDGTFFTADELKNMGINPYDGDLTQPPIHPNCRCTLLPIVE